MIFDYRTQYYRYKHYFLKLQNVYEKPAAKTSLALILTLLAISFFSIFAIKPTLATIAVLNKKLKDSKKANQALEKKIQSLKQAKIAYDKIEKDLSLIERALPNKVNFNSFSSKINLLSYQNNLILTSAAFSKFNLLPTASDPTQLEFKIALSGDYSNIKNFLKDLENLDRLVQINSVNFSGKTEVKNTQLKTNINGTIFWLSPLDKAQSND